MSSTLLKFHEIGPERFDAAILAAAIEASPQPLAITENGNVIYENHSFAQLMSAASLKNVEPASADSGWQTTNFAVEGRNLSLTTARVEGGDLGKSDTQYLAMIGRLVAGVAHDFNNLLTGILLYCDLMQSKADNAGPLWKKTDEIRRAAEHGAALIRQLMTIGREEVGEQPSVCFNQVVRDMEGLLRHLLGEQIEIAMELADDLARVGITCASAQQIILNLALNARDAMPTGGVLRFESRWDSPGEKVFEFVVSDTGHGMDDHTAALARLRPGTRVLAEGPYGAFTARHVLATRSAPKVLLVGIGIGITPLRALLESIPAPPGALTSRFRDQSATPASWGEPRSRIARIPRATAR